MDFDDYLARLAADGARLVRSARLAGLDAAIPSCPTWTVRALVGHTTKVHRWASSILGGADPQNFDYPRPADDELLGAFESGLAALITALRSTPGTKQLWTFLPVASAPVDFWARRQAHETAIHRVDAELAADYGVTEFEPDFAADGLDELLLDFAPDRPSTWDSLTEPRTVTLEPTDVNRGWSLTVGGGAVVAVAEARDRSDLTVLGTASDLYRWAWNRADDSEVALRGDLALADLWRQRFRIGT